MDDPVNTVSWIEIIVGLLGLLTGGAAGALINSLVTNKRIKTDLTLKILEEYLANFELHNHVKAILNDFEKYKEGQSDDQIRERNKVIEIGNWFEIYTLLYKKNLINKKLVKELEFNVLVREFLKSVNRYSDTFKPSIYWKNMVSMKWDTKKEKNENEEA